MGFRDFVWPSGDFVWAPGDFVWAPGNFFSRVFWDIANLTYRNYLFMHNCNNICPVFQIMFESFRCDLKILSDIHAVYMFEWHRRPKSVYKLSVPYKICLVLCPHEPSLTFCCRTFDADNRFNDVSSGPIKGNTLVVLGEDGHVIKQWGNDM